MKAYLVTTGTVFALVTVAHIARAAEMWQRFATDPWFVSFYAFLTLTTAVLTIWAWKLFPRQRSEL
jgi:protein-S-isoprenylcysteine O-methyltransferase Ste14